MNIKQLETLRDGKRLEATAILEEDSPDMEKAEALTAEAEGYQKRIDLMIKNQTPVNPPVPTPTKSGITVIVDETDKKAAVKTWGLGEFCKAIANESMDVRPFKSDDPGFYDVGKAVGPKLVSSITQAKAIHRKAISGMSESVPADGGFLVGTQENYDIMSRVYEEGQIISRVKMTPLSGNNNSMSFRALAESSRVDGSRWGGAQYYWGAEGVEKTQSGLTFNKIELKLNKIFALVYATDELVEDATALEAEIMDVVPRELRFGIQESIYAGTGGGQPTGILNAPCLVTVPKETGQLAATIVSQNVINMWARRWVGASDYVWMINQNITPQLIQMGLGFGTGGALTYMPPGGLSGSQYGSLFGRPVIEIEQARTLGTVGDIALCSWSQYQAIERAGGMQAASSMHVRFIFDEMTYRFVQRIDGEPNAKWPLPLTPYQGTATQGPFIVLAARA